jgi:hypothetical protein
VIPPRGIGSDTESAAGRTRAWPPLNRLLFRRGWTLCQRKFSQFIVLSCRRRNGQGFSHSPPRMPSMTICDMGLARTACPFCESRADQRGEHSHGPKACSFRGSPRSPLEFACAERGRINRSPAPVHVLRVRHRMEDDRMTSKLRRPWLATTSDSPKSPSNKRRGTCPAQ